MRFPPFSPHGRLSVRLYIYPFYQNRRNGPLLSPVLSGTAAPFSLPFFLFDPEGKASFLFGTTMSTSPSFFLLPVFRAGDVASFPPWSSVLGPHYCPVSNSSPHRSWIFFFFLFQRQLHKNQWLPLSPFFSASIPRSNSAGRWRNPSFCRHT